MLVAVLVPLTGCTSIRERRQPPPESGLELRAYQSRTFDRA